MLTTMHAVMSAVLLVAACTPQTPPPAVFQRDACTASLQELLDAPKFNPTLLYTGAEPQEDRPLLTGIVNSAITDVLAMPIPREASAVRERLARVIADVDLFETEDRDRAYRYAVLAWRAACFPEESGLFPVSDDRVISLM